MGTWYEYHALPSVEHVVYYGIFAVHSRHIKQRPLESYLRFMDELSDGSNVEVGHYMERSWVSIFHPLEAKHLQV
jgi:hypothetical protein